MRNKRSLIYIATALLAALFLFSGCGAEEQMVFTGTLESDSAALRAEFSEKIGRMLVGEGQKVNKGDLLAEMDTAALGLDLKKSEAACVVAEAKASQLVSGTRREEISRARAEEAALTAQKDGAVKEYTYRRQYYERMQALYDGGAISLQQLDDAKTAMEKAEAGMRGIAGQQDAAAAVREKLENGATRDEIRAVEAEVAMKKAEVERLKLMLDRSEIRAPFDGVVQSVHAQPGEWLSSGQAVVTLVKTDDLSLWIYVPEKQLNCIQTGGKAVLLWPGERREAAEGVIEYIAPEAEFTPKNIESKENKQEMVFAVRIRVRGDDGVLKPGMMLDADLGGGIRE